MAAGRLRNPFKKARGKALSKRQSNQVKRIVLNLGEKNRATLSTNGILPESDDLIVQDLMAIAQGDATGQRLGAEVTSGGLDLEYTIDGTANGQAVRVLLIQWKEDTQSVTPTAVLLFTSSGSTNAPLGTTSYENRKQFKVLYDKTHAISVNGPDFLTRRVRIPAKKMLQKIIYNGAATTGINHPFLIVWSSELTAQAPAAFSFVTTVDFYDT